MTADTNSAIADRLKKESGSRALPEALDKNYKAQCENSSSQVVKYPFN
jgi:hypothetical protein